MSDTTVKKEEIIQLSKALLVQIEENTISLEQALYKALHIFRLMGEDDYRKWIRLEINGYDKLSLPVGLTPEDATKFAWWSGRYFKKEDSSGEEKFWYATESIPSLELAVAADQLTLQNLKMPNQVTPVTGSFQNENFSTVLAAISKRQSELIKRIKKNQNYIARCKNAVYNVVFATYYKYTFEGVTDSEFTKLKEEIDKQLAQHLPDSLQQLRIAAERLLSDNVDEYSQALSTCRNVIYAFANLVYPASNKTYVDSDGKELKVTGEDYKNRIIAFIDMQHKSDSKIKKLNKARVVELMGRLQNLHSFLSKGAKSKIQLKDARMAYIETYMLLGQLVDYIPSENKIDTKKTKATSRKKSEPKQKKGK